MIYNVFIILVSNAVVPLLTMYFDVTVLINFIRRVHVIEQGDQCNMTQFEANQ